MKSLNASAFTTWEGEEMQFKEQSGSCIVVDIPSARAKLRVSVLLNTMPEYNVRYITTENEIVKLIEEADIIIGAGITAREGILRRKPVIVVGDYGYGGLMTPNTFHTHYNNGFKGKVNGTKDEYFSLEVLEKEIKRSASLTFQELQMMSNQMVTFLHNIDF